MARGAFSRASNTRPRRRQIAEYKLTSHPLVEDSCHVEVWQMGCQLQDIVTHMELKFIKEESNYHTVKKDCQRSHQLPSTQRKKLTRFLLILQAHLDRCKLQYISPQARMGAAFVLSHGDPLAVLLFSAINTHIMQRENTKISRSTSKLQ